VKAAVPQNEAARLAALRTYAIVDTPPEEAFNEITHLASHICQCPIATISLIEADRQWYKAKLGIDIDETPRDVAFCAHTILQQEIVIVKDARLDPRFADNPVVTGPPFVRFYAGVPLLTPDGHALGTLCVVDTEPRELTFEQAWALDSLRRHTVAHLELRKALANLRHAHEEIQSLRAVIAEYESRMVVVPTPPASPGRAPADLDPSPSMNCSISPPG
jgi:GAF domain-containing protein